MTKKDSKKKAIAFNKTTAKKFTVSDSFIEKKRVSEDDDLPKWKRTLCKWMNIVPMVKYQYVYRGMFKGIKGLKSGDVIINQQGVFFAVVHAQQNKICAVNIYGEEQPPLFRGQFYLSENPKDA